MYRRMLQATAVGLVFAASSSVAHAQNALTQGLSLGLDLSYSSVKFDGEGVEDDMTGLGAGLRVGYGFGRMIQPYISWSSAKSELEEFDADLGSLDIGTRVNFPLAGRAWMPFADVAYSIRTATVDTEPDELELDGSAFILGGGVQYFLNSAWSLDGGLQYQIGGFDEGESGASSNDVDIDANTLRLNLGFSWRPMAR